MKLADLHCDTPYELYHKSQSAITNGLHISIDKALYLEKYIQVASIWSNHKLSSDACMTDFIQISNDFKNKVGDLLCKNKLNDHISFLLSVEDLKLIGNDPNKIYTLYKAGVKFATLTWKDESLIGGAWNTDIGLSNYGYTVIDRLNEYRIIADISHGSHKLIEDVLAYSKRPVCATHSNAYSVHPHKRNLTDHHARSIARSGGLIGACLCPTHISQSDPNISDFADHIKHLVNIAGCDSVALGSDFDGVAKLPEGIRDLTSAEYIFEAVAKQIGSKNAEKVFFDNVFNFLNANILGQ